MKPETNETITLLPHFGEKSHYFIARFVFNNVPFIYNKEMYRIESIDVNIELGIDSAIISKVDNNNEEKFFEENFASQPKLKLSLNPIKECFVEEE